MIKEDRNSQVRTMSDLWIKNSDLLLKNVMKSDSFPAIKEFFIMGMI